VRSGFRPRVNGDRPSTTALALRPAWLRRRLVVLVALDATAAGAAAAIARIWSFGLDAADLEIRSFTIPYSALAVVIVPTWLVLMAVVGAYDVGPFGAIATEFGRVVRAGAYFLAVISIAYFVLHLEKLVRGFLVAIVPLAVLFTLGLRALNRWRLARHRARGQTVRRAVVVGSRRSVGDVVRHLNEHPGSGLAVVGACVPGPDEPMQAAHGAVPVLGGTDSVLRALEDSGADVVIFTGSLALGRVRSLAWKVEGSGVDVFVLPALSQRAAQLDVRPVAGLPLLFVDQLGGVARGAPIPAGQGATGQGEAGRGAAAPGVVGPGAAPQPARPTSPVADRQ
jgi:FlaA1/EpsC-like NDP-sugar epimerase